MPRVRRRPNYRQLSEFGRDRIIGLHEAGIGFREIVRRVERYIATLIRCWRSWSEESRHHRRRGSGRPRMTTGDIILQDRNIFLVEIDHKIRMRSLYRRILSYGLISYCPRLILHLTNLHRICMLEWCNARVNWDEEKNRIVLLDESPFCLWAHDGRRRVRSRRGERRFLEFAVERETALTREVMI